MFVSVSSVCQTFVCWLLRSIVNNKTERMPEGLTTVICDSTDTVDALHWKMLWSEEC